MKESRLFRILYYLLEHKKATAPELAEEFEVSVRTIYRDIDYISSAGIPIYATQGKDGGIAILDSFTLDKSMFSEAEKEQILSGLEALIATDGKATDELLVKLKTLFQIKNSSQNNVVMLISFQRRLHFLSTVIMLHFLFFLYKTIVFIYEKQLINISLFLIIIIIPYLKKEK